MNNVQIKYLPASLWMFQRSRLYFHYQVKLLRFKRRTLLDTGSPQSFIHEGTFNRMDDTGAANAPYVRYTAPKSSSGFGSSKFSSQTDRLVLPHRWVLSSTRICAFLSHLVEIVGGASTPALIKRSRRHRMAASSVNTPTLTYMTITPTVPPTISATATPPTLPTTSSTIARACPLTTPHNLSP